jgi:hypothetical protein
LILDVTDNLQTRLAPAHQPAHGFSGSDDLTGTAVGDAGVAEVGQKRRIVALRLGVRERRETAHAESAKQRK